MPTTTRLRTTARALAAGTPPGSLARAEAFLRGARLALTGCAAAAIVAAAVATSLAGSSGGLSAQEGGATQAGGAAPAAGAATGDERTPAQLADELDRIFADAWRGAGVSPNRPCTDEEFVRRIHFDLIGTPPTATQVDDFLKDPSPRKREKLVDALLETPGHARHFANLWAEVLVGVGAGDERRDFAASVFMPWLERQIATAKPWGDVIQELIAAQGTSYANPAVNYSGRLSFAPGDLAGVTSRAFLGVQIQCAQCHDHPYENITQADFNGFAAFWGRIRLKQADIPYEMFGPRAVEAEQKRIDRTVAELMKTGVPEAEARIRAERQRLRTKEISDLSGRIPKAYLEGAQKIIGEAAKTPPKFLKSAGYADKEGDTRRQALGRWIADPANPYTSKALANRLWGFMMGRGIVHPVDDFTSVNLPTVPPALELLAKDTAAHGFDQRRLLRVIAATRAYQTTTASKARSQKAVDVFAAGPLKALSPQQSFDALNVSLGVVADGRTLTFAAAPVSAIEMEDGRGGMRMMDMTGDGAPVESRAKGVLDQAARSFFKTFDDDEGGGGAEFEGTVPQGLFLLNSQVVNGLLSNPRVSILPKVLREQGTESERIRHLFLRTLAREPRPSELSRFTTYVKSAQPKPKKSTTKKDRRFAFDEDAAMAPYADVLWVLLSSSEFGTNH